MIFWRLYVDWPAVLQVAFEAFTLPSSTSPPPLEIESEASLMFATLTDPPSPFANLQCLMSCGFGCIIHASSLANLTLRAGQQTRLSCAFAAPRICTLVRDGRMTSAVNINVRVSLRHFYCDLGLDKLSKLVASCIQPFRNDICFYNKT